MNNKSGIKKTRRVLEMYSRLVQGDIIRSSEEALKYGIDTRSVKRDIDELKSFFADQRMEGRDTRKVIYSRSAKGYKLVDEIEDRRTEFLTNSEILAVCKILLESRAFVKDEMMPVIEKLVRCCTPKEEMNVVKRLIQNEKFYYLEPHHGKRFINVFWKISMAVLKQQYIIIWYQKLKKKELVKRRIKPVGIMFSEYYFYLIAFIDDENVSIDRELHMSPTIYRIDRIDHYKILDENFYVPYKNKFEEGQFRRRVQFMYGGKLKRIKFEYSGDSIEAVLDRLPTAEILSNDNGKYVVQAEVFGSGIDMWLRSQGDAVSLLESEEIV